MKKRRVLTNGLARLILPDSGIANYFIVLLVFAPVFPISAFQEDQQPREKMSIGVGKNNITPSPKIRNWVTGEPYDEVQDSIYVRTLILRSGGKEVVLVTWDLVDAGESATEEVREAISKELNVPKDQILVSASHNHSAPWSPVYNGEYRGKERDTWWAIRHMPAQNNRPYFKEWMVQLIEKTVGAARQASDSMQPATLWIGRADVSEYLQNRRPRRPEWGVLESNVPDGYNYFHEDWNPKILVGGATFGPLDRTMTLITFRDNTGDNIASIFHLAAHAVSIYPFSDALSADWPGEASERISNVLGGEALFLQGAAGDVNPWRRGREAVQEMIKGLADYAKEAYKYSVQLRPDTIGAIRGTIQLPLDDVGKKRTGLETIEAEVQVFTLGSLAIVTLPGEPLTDLGAAIRQRSPFPQTLVLGYSNGNGVHYVGMPGEKSRGGYEMEAGTVGTDEAGEMLVKLAVRLLNEVKNNQE